MFSLGICFPHARVTKSSHKTLRMKKVFSKITSKAFEMVTKVVRYKTIMCVTRCKHQWVHKYKKFMFKLSTVANLTVLNSCCYHSKLQNLTIWLWNLCK